MESNYKVAVVVGSLRKDSISLKIAHVLEGLAPDRLKLEVVAIRDLPLYNPDLEENVRAQVAILRAHPLLRPVPVHGLVFDVSTGRLHEVA